MKHTTLRPVQLALISLFLLPYLVGFQSNPADTTSNSIEVMFGRGGFAEVTRDCAGHVTSERYIPYNDLGARYSHEFSPVEIAATMGNFTRIDDEPQAPLPDGSSLHEKVRRSSIYFTPSAGLNTRYIGIEAGIMYMRDSDLLTRKNLSRTYIRSSSFLPSGKLRIGELDHIYLSSSLYDNLPIGSGGGLYDIGLGMSLGKPHSSLWLGIAGGPYDAAIVSMKGEFVLERNVGLLMRGGVGTGEPAEYGLSVGTKIHF